MTRMTETYGPSYDVGQGQQLVLFTRDESRPIFYRPTCCAFCGDEVGFLRCLRGCSL